MADQANPPLTGREFDFAKRYFGHDYSFKCAVVSGGSTPESFREDHKEPGIHRVVGWLTPHPEVGDVFVGFVHQEDGETHPGKLVVLEVEHHPNPPDYFSAVVREYEG